MHESCQWPNAAGFYIEFWTAAQTNTKMIPSCLILADLQLKADQGCTETSINTSSPDLLSVLYLFVATPLMRSSWCSSKSGQKSWFQKWPLTLNGGSRSVEWKQWTSAETEWADPSCQAPPQLLCALFPNQYTLGTLACIHLQSCKVMLIKIIQLQPVTVLFSMQWRNTL